MGDLDWGTDFARWPGIDRRLFAALDEAGDVGLTVVELTRMVDGWYPELPAVAYQIDGRFPVFSVVGVWRVQFAVRQLDREGRARCDRFCYRIYGAGYGPAPEPEKLVHLLVDGQACACGAGWPCPLWVPVDGYTVKWRLLSTPAAVGVAG